MHRTLMVLALGLCIYAQAQGQSKVKARVVYDSSGIHIPIVNLSVSILPSGEKVTSDRNGFFRFNHLGKNEDKSMLVFHFSNGSSDTLFYIPSEHDAEFVVSDKYLVSESRMQTALITKARIASTINSRGIQKIEILNEEEFKKAACCTLSESFETNNTIEVSNADGVSGIRQVEMLGLAGKYVLMTKDNIPTIRGLNVLTGLNQIPGPMVSGVHIAKGAGSVTNGYEGITGALNFALKAEPKDPSLFLNGYINGQGRGEGNLILKSKINKRTFDYSYLHYGSQFKTHDQGNDGFTDIPLYTRIMVGNQLRHHGNKTEGQLGFTYTSDDREGGDIRNYHASNHAGSHFQFSMKESKAEIFGKLGFFLNKDGSKSIGNIFSASQTHSSAVLNNLIGRKYTGSQDNVTYTSLYGSPEDKKWSTKAGLGVVYDGVSESFSDTFNPTYNPSRKELSIGVFNELVYKAEKLTWVLGNRLDHNSIYGWLYTPRMHMKFDLTHVQQLHLQIGLGRRTPWILAENLPWLINNRELVTTAITGNVPAATYNGAYNMPQETAWNMGGSYTLHSMAFGFPATLSVDGYYTYFIQQVVLDRDRNPGQVIIEAQQGNKTRMGQVDFQFMPHRRLDVKLSYRYVHAVQNLGYKNQIQAMQSPHRALAVINYKTRSKWFFDLITQVNSPKRLPSTSMLPEASQKESYSPWYAIVNAQVRKNYKNWEFYAGAENLLNVRQNSPYLNTYANGVSYFDAAFAWGPTMGRNIYAGFRFTLK